MRTACVLAATLALAPRAPAAPPDSADEKAARETVGRYLAAFAKKDVAAAMAEWDAAAPRYAAHKELVTTFCTATGPLTAEVSAVSYARLVGEVPIMHVYFFLRGNDAKTGRPQPGGGLRSRVFEFRPAGNGWKIRACESIRDYYPPLLMDRLVTARERTAFLRDHRANCRTFSDTLYEATTRLADAKQFDAAARACDRAAEVAEFLDSLRERAWTALHRGVVLEARGRFADALAEIDAALTGFRREQMAEGEAVALCRRGRVLVRLDRAAEAGAAFAAAADLTDDLVYYADRDDMPALAADYLDAAEIAASLDERLTALEKQSRPAEALEVAERLLEIQLALYGASHAAVATTYIETARLHAETGRHDRAKAAMAAAQTIISALYAPAHDKAAVCRCETGRLAVLAGFTPAQTERYWGAVRDARRAVELVRAGKANAALELARATTAVRAELCGRDSLDATEGDALEAFVLLRMNKFLESAECHHRLDRLYAKIYGPGHKQVRANLRWWIAAVQRHADDRLQAGAFAAARDAFKTAADLRERLPPDEPIADVPALAFFRGMQAAAAGWAVPAEKPAVQDALRLVLGSKDLFDLFAGYRGGGDASGAVKRFEAAAETLRAAFGPDDPSVTLAGASLVCLSLLRGDVERGAAESRKLVAGVKRAGFQNHPAFGTMVATLAFLTLQRGDLAESGALLHEAAELLEAAWGKDHLYPLAVRGLLADWYRQVGESSRAFTESVDVVRRLQRMVRADLDRTARGVGRFALLKARTARPGIEHVIYAEQLALLADFYLTILPDLTVAELARVDATYRHQERELRTAFGENSPQHAKALADLCVLAQETGKPAEVEKYLDRLAAALAGPGKPNFFALGEAQTRSLRAEMCLALGRFAEAEALFRKAAERGRAVHGAASAVTYSAEAGLAAALGGQGKTREAVAAQLRALAGSQAAIENVVGFAPDDTAGKFTAGFERHLNLLVTLVGPTPDAVAVETLWTWVVRRKGILLDASCRFRAGQLALAADPKQAGRVRELRTVQQQLTALATRPPTGLSTEQLARDRQKLRDAEARLEDELKRELARVRPESLGAAGAATFARVREKVPAGAALVEFVRYTPYNFTAAGNEPKWGKARYLALVLPPGLKAEPNLVDLGEAQAIDDAVADWRETVRTFREEYRAGEVVGKTEARREKALNQKGRLLDRQLLDPIRPHLGGAAVLVLVPDGPLHLLPFAALVDEKGRYVAETTRVGYLSSTRDLLRPVAAPGDGVAVFAGPDFELSPVDRWAAVRKLGLPPAPGGAAVRGPEGRAVRGGWKELEGARGEADDVFAALKGGRFGRVETVVGADALEERLKAVKSPRILHVATHGFFLEKTAVAGGGGIESRLRQSGDPLLRSGLVLAGANRWRDQAPTGAVLDDGWLTAAEVSLLDLRGTELVVLSACEAGLGDVRGSEGVYGLRRSFLYAGARSVVATLEQVPDAESRELMRLFYGRLGAGAARGEALREAQRAVIAARRKAGGAAHPFFWASYVLIGDGG